MKMQRLGCFLAFALGVAGCGREGSGDRPPVAIAGDDVEAWVGEAASLDGSTSFDPEELPLTYSWRVLSGPAGYTPAGIGNAPTVAFTAPIAGSYVVELDVFDGASHAYDVVVVNARTALDVVATSPQDGGANHDLAPAVVVFSAPIRPWTASLLLVEDITDPALPVEVLGSVSVEDGDTSLVFSPADPWADGTPYRMTIGTDIRGIDGVAVRTAPISIEFEGALLASDAIAPRVLSATPANLSIDRSVSSFIDVVFSEPIDASTLSGATFTLTPSGFSALPSLVSLSAGGMRALLVTTGAGGAPVALAADTEHAVSIAASVQDANGNALDGNGDGTGGDAFASTFRTAAGSDSVAPYVVSVSPFLGAQGVSVKLPVSVTFSEPIDPASVDATTLVVTTAGGVDPIPGTISMQLGNTVAVFEAASNLRTASRYDVRIGSAIRDVSQNSLGADVTSYWVTGSSPPPAVNTVTPPSVPVNTTITIEIAGEDFVNGATVAVLGGGVLVGNVTWLSSDLIQAEITLSPTATLGLRSVRVINPDSQSGTGLNVLTLTPKPPVVISLNPTARQRGGAAADIIITGTDFRDTPTDPTVAFTGGSPNGVTVNSVTYNSTTQLTANVTIAGTAEPGARSVTITNPGGLADTLTNGFTVLLPAPTITTPLAPASARRTATPTVVITGTNFQTAGTTVVSFGSGIGVSNVSVVSATQIDVDISVGATANLGARNVTVTNPDGQSVTAVGAFAVTRALPVVEDVNPSSGSRQGPTIVGAIFTGTDFDCSGSPGTVPAISIAAGITIGPVSCGASTSNQATTLTANLTLTSSATTGLKNVTVTNPGPDANTTLGKFTVNPERPTLTSASPNPDQGETRTVNVFGDFFQATPTISLPAGFTVNSVTFVSATQVDVNLTVAFSVMTGTYNLTLTNPDGQSQMASILTVDTAPPPTVASVTPNFGEQSSSAFFTIDGTGFQPGAGMTTVAVSGAGVTVTSASVMSPTTISARFDVLAGAATTLRDVTVTNPVGASPSGTGIGVFRVTGPAPTLTSLSVTSGVQGTSIIGVTLNGSNFRTGIGVNFGAGITVSNIALVGPSPAISLTCDLAISSGAPTGFHDVTVTNADFSAATLGNGFTVTSAGGGPTVSQVRPSRLVQGKTITLEIVGSGFDPAATVTLSGGLTPASTTFVSTSVIRATFTLACGEGVVLGLRDLTVQNPDTKSGTLANSVTVAHGMVINEVITEPITTTGTKDELEIFNGSGCTVDLTNWRIETLDNVVKSYEIGTEKNGEIETFSGGASLTSFGPDKYLNINDIDKNDGGGDDLKNKVFIVLFSVSSRWVDDVEIGDNEEADSATDGAPANGNDGANQGTSAKEAVARCPNGADSDNDINDFYQDEVAGRSMPRTDRASNSPLTGPDPLRCPVCANGRDDDGDGWIDLKDRGCGGVLDMDEADSGPATQCSDGVDNGDPDVLVDEADPDCYDSADNDESM